MPALKRPILTNSSAVSVLRQDAASKTFLLHAQLHALCAHEHECTRKKVVADTGRLAPVSQSADRSSAHRRLQAAIDSDG